MIKQPPVPKPIAPVKQAGTEKTVSIPPKPKNEEPVAPIKQASIPPKSPTPTTPVKQASIPPKPKSEKPTIQIKPRPAVTIHNKYLIESLHYLKQNNLLPESKSKIKFETAREAEDAKKEEIIDIIKEKANTAKQDITELQKAGYNLHLETIKLIAVPLKQKVWLSTLAKKDLENILKIIDGVNLVIVPLKKENEAKIAEKERLEKEAVQREKQLEKLKEQAPIKKPSPSQAPKSPIRPKSNPQKQVKKPVQSTTQTPSPTPKVKPKIQQKQQAAKIQQSPEPQPTSAK